MPPTQAAHPHFPSPHGHKSLQRRHGATPRARDGASGSGRRGHGHGGASGRRGHGRGGESARRARGVGEVVVAAPRARARGRRLLLWRRPTARWARDGAGAAHDSFAGLRRTMPDVKAAAATATVSKAAAGDSPSPAATPAPALVVANSNGTPQKPPPIPAAAFDMPKPNLRGLNKPKCIQCGNVARSRCPFQCCKSCCYKAQNPCHIHVLKQTNTLPDKPSPAIAPATEQPSANLPATSSASRLAALQKLPQHFLKSLQTKKSLTKKDVVGINKWRFMKLKEHMQGDIDAENEAYERYPQHVGLLEETFCPMEDADVEPEAETTSSEEERMDLLVSEAKVRLKSDKETADSFKERVATILDEKMKKLLESQSANEDDKPSDPNQDDHPSPMKFSTKQKMERTAKLNELLGKLTRARSKEDLKPCRDLIEQLFGKENGASVDNSNRMGTVPGDQESAAAVARPYSIPKLCTRMEVDEDFASKINDECSSLSQVVQL